MASAVRIGTRLGFGLWTLSVVLGSTALAQPQEPEYTAIQLRKVQGVEHGTLGTVDGTTAADGDKYSVKDLDLMQPVAVRLQAMDPQRPAHLEVVKGDWSKVYRNCTTGEEGTCEVRFRTQGNFGIHVSAPAGSGVQYRLAVWAGEEIKQVPANLVVAPKTAGVGHGWSRLEVLVAVVAAALIVLIILVALGMRRSRRRLES